MPLTGKFTFRKTLWGKIVLQIEEEIKPFWSKSGVVKQRWRDATLMDLTAPEMRPLLDLRFWPYPRLTPFVARGGETVSQNVVLPPAPQADEELHRTAH